MRFVVIDYPKKNKVELKGKKGVSEAVEEQYCGSKKMV